jgi:ribose transport system permease protein
MALLVAAGLGAGHGLLVTRLRLQPFVVTLCGLLVYRGVARGLTGDQTQGFGVGFESLRWLASGRWQVTSAFAVPAPCLILVVIAVLAGLFLTRTIWGRYLLAIGRNEEAARLSGIRTDRMTVLAYTLSSALAGLGGLLFVLDVNSAQASDFGNFYELYAIAGAVLGGCALRGGEGSILGVLLGATLMQTLRNAIRLSDLVPDQLEFAVIGVVILAGVSADELAKRWLASASSRGRRR